MSRIVLIGCGKTKREGAHPARELYTGPLFADRLAYAEAAEEGADTPWWIISAGAGLLAGGDVVPSYDVTMRDLAPVDRAAVVLTWVHELLDELPDDARLRDVVVEIHAGADYAEPLRDVLKALGIGWDWPVDGLGIGEQRAYYARAVKDARLGLAAPRPASLGLGPAARGSS